MLSGMPYPIVKYPLGFLFSQKDLDQVRSDLLVLLLTNPGERVMLPDFGTPLRSLLFEPNDPMSANKARDMIIQSINKWEPRITIKSVVVTNGMDTGVDADHVLGISIEFFDPGKISQVQELRLEIPTN